MVKLNMVKPPFFAAKPSFFFRARKLRTCCFNETRRGLVGGSLVADLPGHQFCTKTIMFLVGERLLPRVYEVGVRTICVCLNMNSCFCRVSIRGSFMISVTALDASHVLFALCVGRAAFTHISSYQIL